VGLVAADGDSLGVVVAVLADGGEQVASADISGDACAGEVGSGDGVVRIDGVIEAPGVLDAVSVGSQVGPAVGPAEAGPAAVSIAKPRAGRAAKTAANTTGLRWSTVMAGRRLQVARSTRPPWLIEWLSHRRPDRRRDRR
jgi:hypothetical protein